jgi:hypothetical protein
VLWSVYAADVEIGDVVMPAHGGSARPGRKVVQIELVGPDELRFHYEDDGEPDTYDAKTELPVARQIAVTARGPVATTRPSH